MIDPNTLTNRLIDGGGLFLEGATYASTTSIAITGVDYTSVIMPGTKFILYDTGDSSTKCGYVATSTFSTDTTLTLIEITAVVGGGLTTLTNNPFTDVYFSNMPQFRDHVIECRWLPTITGYSGTPTGVYTFWCHGQTCTLNMQESVNGTSTATNATYTLPIQAGTRANLWINGAPYAVNNGSAISDAYLQIASGATTVELTRIGGFTASNGKRHRGMISYTVV